MKTLLVIVVAALATACVPGKPAGPPTAALRPLAVHTCVANATVWFDGANVPTLRDVTDAAGNATFPRFPATLGVFNLHASAPTLPEYGAVLTATPGTDPLIIILGTCAK